MFREHDDDMVIALVIAMKEKLRENVHKDEITSLDLHEAIEGMRQEMWELTEELNEKKRDYHKIRRELADIANFVGAAVHACDKMILEEG